MLAGILRVSAGMGAASLISASLLNETIKKSHKELDEELSALLKSASKKPNS